MLALPVAVLGAIVVAIVYYHFFGKAKVGYIDHPFWFGQNKAVIRTMVGLQIAAAIGFLLFLVPWVFQPPDGPLFPKPWVLPLVLALFFGAWVAWPYLTQRAIDTKRGTWAVVACLVLAALCSLYMLAGASIESNPRWYVVLGLALFCGTTVFGDGVLWNAKFVQHMNLA